MERLPRNYTLLTDQYQLSMSNAYFQNNMHEKEVVFDAFFRKVPNGGSYAIMAGVDKIIPFIQNFRYSDEEIKHFEKQGYNKEFINYLKNFKFRGTITAVPDGTPVFPNEPIITVKAPLIDAQLIETALLSIINGAMEHATGARNVIESANGYNVMEFGARRADGLEAALDSSIYGYMAGCFGTSNVLAAEHLGIKPLGTQAHSFIESFDTELEAFIAFAKVYPNNCTLLVDTYNTLESGVPNAIKTFKWMKENNLPLDNIGIRVDSGDLAYLSKEARKMFNEAGFPNVKIVLSNGLNAKTIDALIKEGAQFNVLGVGDNISKPEGRMGCVYKVVALKKDNEFVPKIKLSNDVIKIVNPGYKKVYRTFDNNTGYATGDVIDFYNKKLPENNMELVNLKNRDDKKVISDFHITELQVPIFVNGALVYDEPTWDEKRKYCNDEMNKLYPEIRRVTNPHIYHVSGTKEYVDYKYDLIEHTRKRVK